MSRSCGPLCSYERASKELAKKLDELERRVSRHSQHIKVAFDAIRKLMAPEKPPPSRRIGFQAEKGKYRSRETRCQIIWHFEPNRQRAGSTSLLLFGSQSLEPGSKTLLLQSARAT